MTQLVILVDYPISPVWLKYLDLPSLAEDFQVIFVEIKITEKQKKAFSAHPNFQLEPTITKVEISDAAALLKYSRQLKSAIVVDLLALKLASYLAFNMLLRRGQCVMVKFIIGILPPQAGRAPFVTKGASLFAYTELWSIFKRLVNGSVTRGVNASLIYDYSVLGGLWAGSLLSKHPGKTIASASFDFWEYSKLQFATATHDEFALFIEENLVDDTDFVLTGTTKGADAECYFKSMRECLHRVQTVTGTQVKILPHPKTNRDRLKKYFPDFHLVEESSAIAISNSRFVITHASTAISYAVLAKKPIILARCDGLSLKICMQMDAMGKVLGIVPYDIDTLSQLIESDLESLVPTESRRRSYIDNFVRHPEAQLFSFASIVKSIREKTSGGKDELAT